MVSAQVQPYFTMVIFFASIGGHIIVSLVIVFFWLLVTILFGGCFWWTANKLWSYNGITLLSMSSVSLFSTDSWFLVAANIQIKI